MASYYAALTCLLLILLGMLGCECQEQTNTMQLCYQFEPKRSAKMSCPEATRIDIQELQVAYAHEHLLCEELGAASCGWETLAKEALFYQHISRACAGRSDCIIDSSELYHGHKFPVCGTEQLAIRNAIRIIYKCSSACSGVFAGENCTTYNSQHLVQLSSSEIDTGAKLSDALPSMPGLRHGALLLSMPRHPEPHDVLTAAGNKGAANEPPLHKDKKTSTHQGAISNTAEEEHMIGHIKNIHLSHVTERAQADKETAGDAGISAANIVDGWKTHSEGMEVTGHTHQVTKDGNDIFTGEKVSETETKFTIQKQSEGIQTSLRAGNTELQETSTQLMNTELLVAIRNANIDQEKDYVEEIIEVRKTMLPTRTKDTPAKDHISTIMGKDQGGTTHNKKHALGENVSRISNHPTPRHSAFEYSKQEQPQPYLNEGSISGSTQTIIIIVVCTVVITGSVVAVLALKRATRHRALLYRMKKAPWSTEA